jgi:hypothetical protein
MRTALTALLLLAVLGTASACDTGGDDGTLDLEPGTFVATVGGDAFDAAVTAATRGLVINDQYDITFRGEDDATVGDDPPTTTISFTLLDVTDTPATYDLASLSTARITIPDAADATTTYTVSGDGGSGAVTITAISDEGFEGTFRFTAVADDGTTVEVTDGAFNLRYDVTM